MYYRCKTNYMCNIDVYPTPALYVCKYYCKTYAVDTCVIHLLYLCNTHTTPHMYGRCGTTVHARLTYHYIVF